MTTPRFQGFGNAPQIGADTRLECKICWYVYDPADGTQERVIPLKHPDGAGAVLPAVSGSMLIEQRGSALAAFGPA